jgi:hypothetical protein
LVLSPEQAIVPGGRRACMGRRQKVRQLEDARQRERVARKRHAHCVEMDVSAGSEPQKHSLELQARGAKAGR